MEESKKNYKKRGPRYTSNHATRTSRSSVDEFQVLNLDSEEDMSAVKMTAQKRKSRIEKRKKHKGSKKGGKFSLILLLLCVAIFVFSGYKLFSLLSEYKAGSDEYKAVIDSVVTSIDVEADDNVMSYEEYYIDFKELKAQNPDAIAWIRFDVPEQINYPIMQGGDNDFYLRRTFQKEYNIVGSIFLDTNNDPTFEDTNTIIYGHNMKDGSMFSDLKKYEKEEFGKENPYYYIYTPDGKATKYQVAAVEIIQATDLERYSFNFGSDEEYQEYIDVMLQNSMYATGVTVTTEDKITTLSTCTDDGSERFIVQGVRVEEKEMVKPKE